MKKKLLQLIIKTTFVSSVFTFLLVMILQITNSDKHMKNHYMPFFTEILLMSFVWFLSISLLPIFLNSYLSVRRKQVYSFFSFYAALIIFTLYFFFDETLGFKENRIYFIAVFLPYYLVLSINYFNWRKSLNHL